MYDLRENGKYDPSVFNGVAINKKDFDAIVSENMDLQDSATLNTICSINEADRAAVLTSLTSKLYDNIVDKVDDIDFGSIATSRGDITKIENYERLLDCIELMRSIVKECYCKCKRTNKTLGEMLCNELRVTYHFISEHCYGLRIIYLFAY